MFLSVKEMELRKVRFDETYEAGQIDFSGDISAGKKAWKDVWSAGQGLGAIDRIATVQDIVKKLEDEYTEALLAEWDQVKTMLQTRQIAQAA